MAKRNNSKGAYEDLDTSTKVPNTGRLALQKLTTHVFTSRVLFNKMTDKPFFGTFVGRDARMKDAREVEDALTDLGKLLRETEKSLYDIIDRFGLDIETNARGGAKLSYKD